MGGIVPNTIPTNCSIIRKGEEVIGVILTPILTRAETFYGNGRPGLHTSFKEVSFGDGSITFRNDIGDYASFSLPDEDGEQLYSLLQKRERHTIHHYQTRAGLQFNLVGREMDGKVYPLSPLE